MDALVVAEIRKAKLRQGIGERTKYGPRLFAGLLHSFGDRCRRRILSKRLVLCSQKLRTCPSTIQDSRQQGDENRKSRRSHGANLVLLIVGKFALWGLHNNTSHTNTATAKKPSQLPTTEAAAVSTILSERTTHQDRSRRGTRQKAVDGTPWTGRFRTKANARIAPS